jgi:hypothetical protein
MNIIDTPEKAFNNHLWELLQEIARKSIIHGPNKPIELVLDYQALGEKGMREEIDFLESMAKWQIIKYDTRDTISHDNGTRFVYVRENYPVFPYTYGLYKHGYEHNAEPGQLFTLLKIITSHTKENQEVPEDILDYVDGTAYIAKRNGSEKDAVAKLDYNPETGIGRNGSKKFKLKDGSSEHRVFSRLYANLNKRVNRFDVLELAKFYENGEDIDPARESDETEAINTVAKKLRSKIGLEPDQLVMNAGNLTLLGKKATQSTPI